MKNAILLLLFISVSTLYQAQTKYDTISFDHITLNNHSLYTKFSNIKNNVDDTKTSAKLYTGEDVRIPFRTFASSDILYTVMSKNLVFTYQEIKPNDIFITYVKPNNFLKLKLKINNDISLSLNRKTNIYSLKKYFKNSYATSLKDGKDFRLIVKSGYCYQYLDVVFDKKKFTEIYLLTFE